MLSGAREEATLLLRLPGMLRIGNWLTSSCCHSARWVSYTPCRTSRETTSGVKNVLREKNTIFSLSSGRGKAGVSVIRISGPDAFNGLKALLKPSMANEADAISYQHGVDYELFLKYIKDVQVPKSRQLVYRKLHNPISGVHIDDAMVVAFPGPRSFTGEDVVELNVHGSEAVIKHILGLLSKLPGMRTAEAGEFTKRAFFNNKLDLTEVEGLGDLINAETEAQRIQALRQLSGQMGKIYEDWRAKLLKSLAFIEAMIDFGESEDLEVEGGSVSSGLSPPEKEVLNRVNELKASMESYLNDGRRGERLRNGFYIAIGGLPNVGKSTLLNCLSRRDVAIVSDIAGTTRDVMEVSLDLNGFPFVIQDTAGIRDETKTNDVIELEGVRRARRCLENGDVNIVVLDAQCLLYSELGEGNDKSVMANEYKRLYKESIEALDLIKWTEERPKHIVVFNKCDLVRKVMASHMKHDVLVEMGERFVKSFLQTSQFSKQSNFPKLHFLSCKDEDGVSELILTLTEQVATHGENEHTGQSTGKNTIITQERHREHLVHCVELLHSFSRWYGSDEHRDVVMASEELRQACICLGKITGRTGVEDVLDVIFSDFCIGK
eukprot:Nk52_evm11s166 gene=Nk52_evmTU11s166